MWERYSGSLLWSELNFKCKGMDKTLWRIFYTIRYCNVFGDTADSVLAKKIETMYVAI